MEGNNKIMQNSKLANIEIKQILIDNYGIVPETIIEINRGTADIFKIITRRKKYIFKEFIEGRKANLVIKEIEIINFLKENDICVPTYVKTIKNDMYCENRGRIIVVQEFIDGYTLENSSGNYEEMIKSAKMLGKLVKVFTNYKSLSDDGIIEKNFSSNGLKNGINKMKILREEIKSNNNYSAKIKEDLDWKIDTANELLQKFEFNIINDVTIANSHGDYCSQQLIFKENGEVAVIDFERAKRIPIVWEIMRSYSYIDRDCKDGEINIDNLYSYFKEFQKYYKLNQFDLIYAADIYLIQLIVSVFGYKEYNDNYEKEELLNFGFFRTNLCRNLYKNRKQISEKLKNCN